MEILQMIDINKSFYGVPVLKGVNFDVIQGEVHALLGENGAGKSTLMNLLGGVHPKDSGTIIFDGNKMEHITVKKADAAGIAFVHQELNVINDLKVYENIFLNKEITNRYGKLNKKAMLKETVSLFARLGVDIKPDELVANLETSQKQLLEIAKALHLESKLFILDEPTTALNNTEIEKLFAIIRNLKTAGKSFIFISHKMPEIFEIADRYTVLRNGAFIHSGKISDATPESVTKLMVGEQYANDEIYEKRELSEPIIEMENLSGPGFHDITLTISKGEVIGFTGLQGAGCSDLMQGIFGAKPVTGGALKIGGRKTEQNSIFRSMKSKIGMIPANRKENSIIPDMNILENGYIAEHCLSAKRQHIHVRYEIRKFNELKALLNIKANSHNEKIVNLSGGNQQKVIILRWLNTNADILLLDNPTQGIDVGAKAEIYKLILDLSKNGKTIIVNTLEIPEIQKVVDRCVVFYHGGIQAVLDRKEISEEKVMLFATNAVSAKDNKGKENSV